ncbi:MAG: YbbR-like domain-containing protein [Prevotellaceae bacterium]|jgi:YbbR domain-containing protein|nr:YbbR-like domain-containing protein [Prevotellaceae bacterium]
MSKNVLSFLFFLCLSTVFWFANTLEKERETTMSLPVRYTGIPRNIQVTNSPETKMTVSLKDKGNTLLGYYRKRPLSLVIDLVDRDFYEKGEIIITSDELAARISKLMLPSTIVQSISPDTLYVQYEKLSTRILPVRINGEIEPAQQYTFSEATRVEPGEITVFAPKHVLDTLSSIKTEYVKLNNVKDNISVTIKLMPVESLRFSTDEVRISVFPEKFTEKNIKLPVTFVNCPRHLTIRTFPATVNVKFNVGLSRFNRTDDIRIVLDYNKISKTDIKQKPEIVTNNPYISNIQLSPEEVEFVLEEK